MTLERSVTIGLRVRIRHFGMTFGLLFTLAHGATAHTIPDDVAVQVFAKPEHGQFHLLVRLPFDALADTVFPLRARGALDLPRVSAMLPDAARIWVADWIDLYESGALLPKPRVVVARVSLASDRSFASYEDAWALLTGPDLPDGAEVFPSRAMFDVALDYPIHSERSQFAIQSRLARLGGRVVTALQFLPPGRPVRAYGYVGNPGLFALDSNWYQAVGRFVPLGFGELVKGSDYLLFLLCAAMLLRRWPTLMPFVAAFAVGHSVTLIASAYGLAPDALWFPVLFETVIALSIVYLAFENIFKCALAPQLWVAVFGFGLVYGFGFSFSLRPALQFGGSHMLISILSFNAGVELGILMVLLVLVSVFKLAFRHGAMESVGTIFLAGLAAHTGWHRMIERARWLSSSQLQWPTLDPNLLGTTKGMVILGAVLAIAICLLVRATRREVHYRESLES
jgi:hypothetical protein